MPDAPVPFVFGLLALVTVAVAFALGWYALASARVVERVVRAHADYRQRGPRTFERLTTIGLSRGRGVVHYRACADVGADERGLRIALVLPMFRHPPLLIPWEPLRFEALEDANAILRVDGTNVTLRLRSAHLIAQLRYWVEDGGDADEDLALLLEPPSA